MEWLNIVVKKVIGIGQDPVGVKKDIQQKKGCKKAKYNLFDRGLGQRLGSRSGHTMLFLFLSGYSANLK